MLIKELANICNIHKNCSTTAIFKKAIHLGKIKTNGYFWLAPLLYTLTSYLASFSSGACFWVGIVGMLVSFVLIFVFVDRILANEYASEYEAHAISSHPFGMQRIYLRYAIFLKNLPEKYQSEEEISKILAFAKIANKPAPSFKLMGHPIIIPITSLLIALISEYITELEVWQNESRLLLIFLVFMGLAFLLQILDVVRGLKQDQAELVRFLEWAEIDIEHTRKTIHDNK